MQEYISTIVFCFFCITCFFVFYDTSDHILPAVLYIFFSISPEPPDCVLTAFYRQLQQLTEPTTQRLPGVLRDHPPSIHYTLLPQVFRDPKKKKACIKDKIIKYCILNCFIRKTEQRNYNVVKSFR